MLWSEIVSCHLMGDSPTWYKVRLISNKVNPRERSMFSSWFSARRRRKRDWYHQVNLKCLVLHTTFWWNMLQGLSVARDPQLFFFFFFFFSFSKTKFGWTSIKCFHHNIVVFAWRQSNSSWKHLIDVHPHSLSKNEKKIVDTSGSNSQWSWMNEPNILLASSVVPNTRPPGWLCNILVMVSHFFSIPDLHQCHFGRISSQLMQP